MNAKEIITDALKVYAAHCATQVTRKRVLNGRIPTWDQLKTIEEVRNIWKAKFDSTMTTIVKIDKGELLGL